MSLDAAQKQAMHQCYTCVHKRKVPGNAHIGCVNPSSAMMGDSHGIKNGWWYYPLLFDPVWNLTICPNYEASV